LVESDLRLPSLHKIFGLPHDPGFSDCLVGTRKWTEVVRGTTDFLMSELAMDKVLHVPGIENLSIITSGPIPPNPIDLFNSPEIGNIFKEMSQQYDLVILDCPPILLFADALLMGGYSTGLIIVYRVNRIARNVLKRAKDQLQNVKVKVLGLVLNNVKTSEMGSYYGYVYYYSYKYYSKDTPREKK
jgi:capsular exopolysaccharide synthesis family protein